MEKCILVLKQVVLIVSVDFFRVVFITEHHCIFNIQSFTDHSPELLIPLYVYLNHLYVV